MRPVEDLSPTTGQVTTASRTIRLTIAYDGTAYAGWQIQPQVATIQDVCQRAIEKVLGETVDLVGSGRTDSGVHALGQVASFDTASTLPAETIRRAVDANTPEDVAILAAADARLGFHARRDAIGKRYRYVIHDGRIGDVFRRRFSWHVRQELDAAAMGRAAEALLGRHDFRSFESQWPNRASSVRTVSDVVVRRPANHPRLIYVEIEADGFLYNMVRAIVGTLVEVGRGAQAEAWVGEVLAAGDRDRAGMTAPAEGLFLMRVDYAEDDSVSADERPGLGEPSPTED